MFMESVCWRAPACSEAPASCCASAACYCLPEDIGVVAMVVTELKLRQIERQVFRADVVIRADDSALEQCPERIQVLSVDFTTHVLAFVVIDRLVPKSAAKAAIARILVSSYEFNLFTDGLANESFQRLSSCIFDNLTNDVAFATDCSDYADLAGTEAAGSEVFAFAVMAIPFFPANEGFVHLYDAHKLLKFRVLHGGAQPVAEIPSSMEGRRFAKEHPSDLPRGNALLTLKHRIQDLKPRQQWNFRVLKDGSGSHRKAISISTSASRIRAFPLPRQRNVVNRLGFTATRTSRAVRPTTHNQELAASIFIGKAGHQLVKRHHA
jgi:hypothetical protein